jgi:hypothetical protein
MKKFEMSMTILYFTVGCSAFCLIPFLVIGKDYLGASSVFVCALSLLVNGGINGENRASTNILLQNNARNVGI